MIHIKINLFFAIASGVLFHDCHTKSTSAFKKTEWLIGTWENKSPDGSIYETWLKINDKELVGQSYIINEMDTVIFENIRLIQEQDSIYYIPTMIDQNKGLPVRFTGKQITEKQFVFENLQHDFPQLISYTRVGTDSLVAEISGKNKGQLQRQTFPMKKVK